MKNSILLINSRDENLERFLLKNNFVVYNVEHGLKALRIINNTSGISLIIYEIYENEEIELGFIEYVRKKFHAIQIIVISSYENTSTIINLFKSGIFNFLIKPLDENILIENIMSCINLKKEIENKITIERKNKEYQKLLSKELEIKNLYIEKLKKELEKKNLELEMIYGKEYSNREIIFDDMFKNQDRIGKYSIIEEISKGGMSVVYRAIDVYLNREVAIKELKVDEKSFSQEIIDGIIRRFKKEAEVMAKLNHNNILKVFDVMEQNNKHYIIMEYIEGNTLESILKSMKLPIIEIINISQQICLALDYIHSNNIIHRDIKPSNIMIDTNRIVKLMDFGVIRDTSISTITPTGSVIGTISYIAPEQSYKNFDYRVDIFSLGTIIYEMITGENPFEDESYAKTFLKISSFNPEPPSTKNQKCIKELDDLVLKSISKNPNDRFSNAKELYNELVKIEQLLL
jgi:tRNA A-37 threonylcarbamoyl transferase component Bud32/FixJ family two-component response regulator